MRIFIEIIRIICLVIVVFFHTYTRYANPQLVNKLPNCITTWSSEFIWIAVPMFFFISGFLFKKQIQTNRFKSWSHVIINKGKHLILPYLIFSSLFMLTGGDFQLLPILRGDYWHLWFLPALFFCFILLYPAVKIVNLTLKCQWIVECVLGAGFFILSILKNPLPDYLMGINNALFFGIYFVLGIIVSNHEQQFVKLNTKYYLWLILTILVIGDQLLPQALYGIPLWNNTIAVSASLLVIFYLFSLIKVSDTKANQILKFTYYSMYIYILHYWVLVFTTSSSAYSFLGLFEERDLSYVLAANFLIAMGTLLISFFLSILLKRLTSFKLNLSCHERTIE